MAVTINITNKERIFIDGANGQQLTPEQFRQRYSRTAALNMGQSAGNQGTGEGEGETQANQTT